MPLYLSPSFIVIDGQLVHCQCKMTFVSPLLLLLLLFLVGLVQANPLTISNTSRAIEIEELEVTVRLRKGELLGLELSSTLSVLSVTSGSTAARAGLITGDKITCLQGKEIPEQERSVAAFAAKLADARNKGEPVQLVLQRAVSSIEVEVRVYLGRTEAKPSAMFAGTLAEESIRNMSTLLDCNNIRTRLVLASPLHACERTIGSRLGRLNGSIVLVSRGDCSMETKLSAVFSAGAAGVVVINNDVGSVDLRVPDNHIERERRAKRPDMLVIGLSSTEGSRLKALVEPRESTQIGTRAHYHTEAPVYVSTFPRLLCGAANTAGAGERSEATDQHDRSRQEASVVSTRGERKVPLPTSDAIVTADEDGTLYDNSFRAECDRLLALRTTSARLFASEQKRQLLYEQVLRTQSLSKQTYPVSNHLCIYDVMLVSQHRLRSTEPGAGDNIRR